MCRVKLRLCYQPDWGRKSLSARFEPTLCRATAQISKPDLKHLE